MMLLPFSNSVALTPPGLRISGAEVVMGVDDPDDCNDDNDDCISLGAYLGVGDCTFVIAFGNKGPTLKMVLDMFLPANIMALIPSVILEGAPRVLPKYAVDDMFADVAAYDLWRADNCGEEIPDGATITDITKCNMLFFQAPTGFPDELSDMDGGAAAIVNAIAADGWLAGFSGSVQMGVGATSMSSYIDFRISATSSYFSVGMTLFSIFTGDFNFTSSVDTNLQATDSSLSTGDISMEIHASAGFDFGPIVDGAQAAIRVLMKFDKYIDKVTALVEQDGEALCKKLGVPGGICKLVPGIADVATDVLDDILTPLQRILTNNPDDPDYDPVKPAGILEMVNDFLENLPQPSGGKLAHQSTCLRVMSLLWTTRWQQL